MLTTVNRGTPLDSTHFARFFVSCVPVSVYQICGACDQLDREDENDRLVLCDGPCKRSFHQSCLGMSTATLQALDTWLCEQCKDREHTVRVHIYISASISFSQRLPSSTPLTPLASLPLSVSPVLPVWGLGQGRHGGRCAQVPAAQLWQVLPPALRRPEPRRHHHEATRRG